jgi:hypothetical protein
MMSRSVYIVGPATCSPSKADLGAEEAKRKERKGNRENKDDLWRSAAVAESNRLDPMEGDCSTIVTVEVKYLL